MQTHIRYFLLDELCMSVHIHQWLLGHKVAFPQRVVRYPTTFEVEELGSSLTPKQTEACKHALGRGAVILQGPPGTGKTTTAATIVFQLVKQRKGSVLVCTGSNTAATHIATAIAKTGVKVLRYFATSQNAENNKVPSSISVWSHIESSSELNHLRELQASSGLLSSSDYDKYNELLRKAITAAAPKVDVIACTCSAAGDAVMASLTFPCVVIDEAAQVTHEKEEC